ncbi:MAG: amidohydrolase [Chloroflexota bacterium]|nr:amidohydrolase [Chloroflexota bacterium]
MNKSSADLILTNANVLTMQPSGFRAEMVAMAGGRIIGVGKNSERKTFQGEQTRTIDCKGKTIIPGFIDAHMHIFSLISSLLSLDCSPDFVSAIADIQRLIASKAAQIPVGSWIKGAEYNEFYLAEKRHPTRWDLDKSAPDHPVRLAHRTRHACVLNSRALALAGISIETPDPLGGMIERDMETGEPTGLLFGMNAFLNQSVIPPFTSDELDRGIRQANEMLLAAGITSFHDASVNNGLPEWDRLTRFKNSGRLRPRVKVMFGFDELEQIPGIRHLDDENLRSGMVKIVIDETRGSLNPSQADLNRMVLAVHKAGYQVALHAIEENTVEAAISAIEYALREIPRNDHRHRIEHCSECPPHLLNRLRETQAVVVTQPAFLFYNGERYLSQVDSAKLPWLYRIGSFQKEGITVAASSDAPIIPPNPLAGIYAAVTRKAQSGNLLSPAEAVTPEQSLRIYTMGGAFASFEENDKGSVSVGKLADLVVLSADPTSVPAEEIRNIAVEKTIIGGDLVWEKA